MSAVAEQISHSKCLRDEGGRVVETLDTGLSGDDDNAEYEYIEYPRIRTERYSESEKCENETYFGTMPWNIHLAVVHKGLNGHSDIYSQVTCLFFQFRRAICSLDNHET